jgi:hypothetical protein
MLSERSYHRDISARRAGDDVSGLAHIDDDAVKKRRRVVVVLLKSAVEKMR